MPAVYPSRIVKLIDAAGFDFVPSTNITAASNASGTVVAVARLLEDVPTEFWAHLLPDDYTLLLGAKAICQDMVERWQRTSGQEKAITGGPALRGDPALGGRHPLEVIRSVVGSLPDEPVGPLAGDFAFITDLDLANSIQHRAFKIGKRFGMVAHVPEVSRLKEAAPRRGFFEREQFDAVRSHLSADLRPVVEVAYITGWRVRSEILTRQWRHVDLEAGWLRLDPGETKNGEGRMFPITPELRVVLERQQQRTLALNKATNSITPWVFHRQGKPIKSYQWAWVKACEKAGVPGRIPHDFRRSAVRNLERAGVPRSAAMAMVGHRTESVYRRYAIVDESMLREAGEKYGAAFASTLQDATSNATSHPDARKRRRRK